MGAKLHRVTSIEGVRGVARAVGVTLAVLVGGFACGSAGTDPVTDAAGLLLDAGGQGDAAAPDAPAAIDAPIGAASDGSATRPDGRVMDSSVVSPGMCNLGSTGTGRPFQACTGDAQCMAGSHCLPLDTQGAYCFRCCDGTGAGPIGAQCDPGSACVQNGAPTLFSAAQVLENHCFFSTCGPGRNNGAGTLESTCDVGKDLWAPGAGTGFTPGFCLTFDDGDGTTVNPPAGSCKPIGAIAVGAACPLSNLPLNAPQCVAGAVCIGPSGAAMGTCAEVCKPDATASNGCAPSAPQKFCQDSSELYTGGGRIAIGTYGFCLNDQTCSVLEDPGALATGGMAADHYGGCTGAPLVDGNAVSCSPTTPARPNGVCGARLGTAPENTPCKNVGGTLPTDFCLPGLTCGDDTGLATDVCRKFCDPAIATSCTGTAVATTCKPYVFNPTTILANNQAATGYGLCKP